MVSPGIKAPKVFVSYSLSDAKYAKELVRALKRRGVRAWLDQFEISPGAPVQEEIEKALRASDAILILLTQESVSNPHVFFEIGAAVGLGKQVLPVMAYGMEMSSLPPPLRFRQVLVRGQADETADELMKHLEAAS
jgi:hypothetical protein